MAACEGVAHVRRPKAKPKTEAPSPGKRENKERNPEQREWVVEALQRIESDPSAAHSLRRGSVIFVC